MAINLGYYNDPEDIKELVGLTNREIVANCVHDNGAFHKSTDKEKASVQGLRPVKYRGKTYYVKKDVDPNQLDSEDNFIDIYQAV